MPLTRGTAGSAQSGEYVWHEVSLAGLIELQGLLVLLLVDVRVPRATTRPAVWRFTDDARALAGGGGTLVKW